MHRFLSALLLGAALLTPVVSKAEEPHRYYDRHGKDWHDWNEKEIRAHHRYYEEQHKTYREYPRARRSDQDAYWRWRHTHADIVVVR